jgi:hypothetical protein
LSVSNKITDIIKTGLETKMERRTVTNKYVMNAYRCEALISIEHIDMKRIEIFKFCTKDKIESRGNVERLQCSRGTNSHEKTFTGKRTPEALALVLDLNRKENSRGLSFSFGLKQERELQRP